ncbi:MAG: putative sulfate transporter [Candidatus Anoxychlamydiales bacterium]|nr:putative sulfate transporter [Candidatus Anoxychlamydiales bacterium]NGX35665.1 putative sulfate transporter [Candidatus Anoxychlamydiales bacterium]
MKKRLIDIYAVQTRIKFFPFIKDIKRYKLKTFKNDIIAALSVALLAIPQSIAYSLLADLPVQAGIFSAIFGSIFMGAFGSSRHLIAGPSTGVAILIQVIIANLMYVHFPTLTGAARDTTVLQLLMFMVFIVGVMQLFFGFFNLGKILQFVSRSVILGYFAGVGVAIIVNQLFYFFGIASKTFTTSVIMKGVYFIQNIGQINFMALLIGIISIGLLIIFKWKFKKFPSALVMIAIVSIFVYFFNFFLKTYHLKVPTLIDLGMRDAPPIKLVLPFLDLKFFYILFFPALAIAMLSILEVSSISKGIATKSGQKIRSNQEVFGVGLSNLILSFFYSSMPSSASVSRTTLNFQAGARTRFASIYSGIILTILVFFFWPFVKHIPLTALAAILIIMVISVVEMRQVKLCFRATLGDAVVFSLTMASCLVFRLDIAFFIGIIISIIFYLKRAAVPNLVEYSFDKEGNLKVVTPKRDNHRKIRVIGIAGELFFAAVDLVQNTLQKIIKEPDVEVIILRLKNIYHVDASICLAILRLNDYLKRTNRHLLICGVTDEVFEIFKKAGVVKQLGKDKIFLTKEEEPLLSTKKAIQKANQLISK